MIKQIYCDKYFSESVNWVDDNNRFVGFDDSQQCCEQFGYVYIQEENDNIVANIYNVGDYVNYDNSFNHLKVVENPDFSNAVFDECQPFAEYGMFKIKDCPDCNWLILYNYHDGYYTHGFVYKKDDKVICKECL